MSRATGCANEIIIKGFYKGEEVSIPVNEASESFTQYPRLLNLRRGDAIRIAIDANGNVSNLIKVFTFNPCLDETYKHDHAEQIREMNYYAGADGSTVNIGKRNDYLLNPYYCLYQCQCVSVVLCQLC